MKVKTRHTVSVEGTPEGVRVSGLREDHTVLFLAKTAFGAEHYLVVSIPWESVWKMGSRDERQERFPGFREDALKRLLFVEVYKGNLARMKRMGPARKWEHGPVPAGGAVKVAFAIEAGAPQGEREAVLTFPMPKEAQKVFRPRGPFEPDIPTLTLPDGKRIELKTLVRTDYSIEKK